MSDHLDIDRIEHEYRENERARLTRDFLAAGVLENLVPGLVRYFVDRVPTGHFLRRILENDLYEAHLRADPDSLGNLHEIILALHHVDLHRPPESWGSRERVAAWLGEASS